MFITNSNLKLKLLVKAGGDCQDLFIFLILKYYLRLKHPTFTVNLV